MQVREAFDLFLAGKSINAIWHHLSTKYTTKWTATKVRNVLKNSLYIGKVHFMGQEYDGVHQPIVEEHIFTAANQLLNSLSREQTKTTAQRNPFRAGYLLSGLLYCGRCGARYSANHGYYKCYSRAKSSPKFVVDPNCKNDNWEIDLHLIKEGTRQLQVVHNSLGNLPGGLVERLGPRHGEGGGVVPMCGVLGDLDGGLDLRPGGQQTGRRGLLIGRLGQRGDLLLGRLNQVGHVISSFSFLVHTLRADDIRPY